MALEAQRNALAEERRQWQTQQEETQRGIDEQREQLTARLAELESQPNALATERDDLRLSGTHWPKNASNGRPSMKRLSGASTSTRTTRRSIGRA